MKRIWSGVLATAVAGTAYAQGPILQPKLAELQPAKFGVPLCPFSGRNLVQPECTCTSKEPPLTRGLFRLCPEFAVTYTLPGKTAPPAWPA